MKANNGPTVLGVLGTFRLHECRFLVNMRILNNRCRFIHVLTKNGIFEQKSVRNTEHTSTQLMRCLASNILLTYVTLVHTYIHTNIHILFRCLLYSGY